MDLKIELKGKAIYIMKPRFNPTPDQTFELEGGGDYNFVRRTEAIDSLVAAGRYDEACEARYNAFITLAEILPEEEAMPLRWEHPNSRAALSVLYGSATDHFRIGDLEMCMAQLELLLDCDPEDHFEGVNLLALCYIAMEEWEAYDELTIDLTDKSAEGVIAKLWALYRRNGEVDSSLLRLLSSRHRAYYEELRREEHPYDERLAAELAKERPSAEAEAREWWLMTEPLWAEYHEFIEALRR